MSSVLPPTRLGRVEFCEQHTTPFSTNAVAIGTTTTAVTDLTTRTTAARAAYNAQQAAKNAARAATNEYKLAVAAMTSAVADILKQIKTKAAISGDSVYSLAEIPVPATPSPKPAPGTPTGFVVTLNPDGSLNLKWKCPNPPGASGTMYQVSRKLGAAGDFAPLGATGTRSYVDVTVPAGTPVVTYQIRAARSTAVGTAAQFVVNLGVGGSGEIVAGVVSEPKLAA
jgi:hypothetical protein